MHAARSPSRDHLAAQQPGDLACGALLREMLRDEELDQILHTVSYESAACLLFLSRRVSSLCSGSEYLERSYARLMQRNVTIRPDREFA